MTTPAGGVYVDVLPDFTGFAGRFAAGVRSLSVNDKIEIRVDVDDEPVKKVSRSVKDLDRDTTSLAQKFRNFNTLTGLSPPKLIAFASSAGLAVQATANLAATLAPLSGLLIALPAVAGAGAIVLGTLKIGLSGVSDTLKAGMSGDLEKYNKGLEKLSPNARDATRALVGMKKPFDEIKKAVQDRLFAGVGDDLKLLGKVYLPELETRLPKVAASLSGFFGNFTGTAADKTRPFFKGFRDLIDATALGLARANNNVGPLTDALGNLFIVAAPLARDLLGSIGSLTGRFADFINEAARTGELREWLQEALDTAQTFGQFLGNLGSIIGSVLGAANSAGGGLLGTLEELTRQVADFLKSAEGAAILETIFSAVAQIGGDLGRVLGAVLPAIGQAVAELAPHIPLLTAALADVLIAMVPLLPPVTQLAILFLTNLTPAIVGLMPLLTTLVGWLTSLVEWVVRSEDVIVPLVAGVLAMVVAVRIINGLLAAFRLVMIGVNIVLAANPIGLVILALVGLAAIFVTAYQKSETFRRIVDATWLAVRTAATVAWNDYIKPALSALIGFITKDVPRAFNIGKDAIGRAWDGIKQKAAEPVNFVIETVLNNGILKAWNFIADKFGLDSLKIGRLNTVSWGSRNSVATGGRGRAFADGGFYDGLIPGAPSGVDNLLATSKTGPVALATGEYIVNSESTSTWLPVLEWINSQRRGFAEGGLFGRLSGGLSKLWESGTQVNTGALDFLSDPKKWLQERLSGVLEGLSGRVGGGDFGKMIASVPEKLVDAMSEMAGKVLGSLGGGRVSAGLAGALSFAGSQVGALYNWGAAGPKQIGYDCSGFMSAILNIIQGVMPPYSRRGSTGTFPWPGFVPGMGAFSIGSTSNTGSGIGHMAGTLNGVNVESRGGDGVVVGPRARGARDRMFGGNVWHLAGFANGGMFTRGGDLPFDIFDPRGMHFMDPKTLVGNVFDQGGWLQPGLSLTYNGTGMPERVLDPADSSAYGRGGSVSPDVMRAALEGMRLEIDPDGVARLVTRSQERVSVKGGRA